ncbi:type IV pilin N-terminal domain-containing protein [Halosimplex sp. J119]
MVGDGARERDESARDPAERAISEFTGVAILIAVTLLVTGSVGLFVLVDPGEDDPGPNANFSFEYIDQSSVLFVEHERGDTFTAGNLTIRSGETAVGWATLANTENSTVIGPGDQVQLSDRNAFGRRVSTRDDVSVYYAPPAGNETLLDSWDESD